MCADAGPQFNVGAVNNTGGLVVFVAVDKGFFAKHGIDGKVVVRNTGPELSKALVPFRGAGSSEGRFA